MRISLEICLQMVDWVLTNVGVLTFLELTNARRDVCIIYMLPVRVLEQKHRLRRRFTFKKANIRRRRQMRRPSYKPSYKTASVGLCFQRKSNRGVNIIWGSLCDLCISILHALHSVHTYTLQHIYHGFPTNSAICTDSPVISQFGVDCRTDHQKTLNLQVNVRYRCCVGRKPC